MKAQDRWPTDQSQANHWPNQTNQCQHLTNQGQLALLYLSSIGGNTRDRTGTRWRRGVHRWPTTGPCSLGTSLVTCQVSLLERLRSGSKVLLCRVFTLWNLVRHGLIGLKTRRLYQFAAGDPVREVVGGRVGLGVGRGQGVRGSRRHLPPAIVRVRFHKVPAMDVLTMYCSWKGE